MERGAELCDPESTWSWAQTCPSPGPSQNADWRSAEERSNHLGFLWKPSACSGLHGSGEQTSCSTINTLLVSLCGSPPPPVIPVWIYKPGLVSGFWAELQDSDRTFRIPPTSSENDRNARWIGINNLLQLHVEHEFSHRNGRRASDDTTHTEPIRTSTWRLVRSWTAGIIQIILNKT